MGYLSETMRNYLLRLGWSHGDDEIIPTAQAIAWFNFESIGKSAARMDYKKLDNLNGHYIRSMDDALIAGAEFLFTDGPRQLDDAAAKLLTPEARAGLVKVLPALEATDWTGPALEAAARSFAEASGLKLGQVAQPLRAALTGKTSSPPLFEMLALLGREESLVRLRAYAS
jgi:glutamyl-tRNA synthetase